MIGSLTMPYDVFVFDSAGRVMEANLIHAPNPGTPEVVTSVAPLKVAFRTDDGRRVEVGVEYSQEVARSKVLEEAELSQRLGMARHKWMKSGSTNKQELFNMLKQAWPKP